MDMPKEYYELDENGWEQKWILKWSKYFYGEFEAGLEKVKITDQELSIQLHEKYVALLNTEKLIINREQYKILLMCRDQEDISIWNEWWRQNSKKEIFLMGAELPNGWLVKGNFQRAHLEKAFLQKAILSKANLQMAKLEGTNLYEAQMDQADLSDIKMQGAWLAGAHLEKTNLRYASLVGTDFRHAYLHGADFLFANLENANFAYADISKTKITNITINTATNFTGANIGEAFIDPGVRGALEYNIRRQRWQKWETQEKIELKYLNILSRAFWWISDYGISTFRIVKTFIFFSFLFAIIYTIWPVLLATGEKPEDVIQHLPFARSLYFSVVTMTTLGFGDIHANPASWLGQFLLMIQVILGYVLLGSLITRLGVVFTGLGPIKKPKPSKKYEQRIKKRICIEAFKIILGILGLVIFWGGLLLLSKWIFKW